jgi:glycerol-3-phosphate O-acyltransferase
LFVPVGLAYDHILEDRVLTAAAAEGTRNFRAKPLVILRAALRIVWGRLRGTFRGFGTAAASFGPPVSLRAFLETAQEDPIEGLGQHLMHAITRVVPILPVPLVAAALAAGATRETLLADVTALIGRLEAAGVVLKLPPQGAAQTLEEAMKPLIQRQIITADLQVLRPELVAFYAASVMQTLDAATR